MALALYAATATLLLWLIHRFVRPLSRGAAVFLFFLPFVFTGWALVANRVYAPIDRTFETLPLSDLREEYEIGEGHNPATSDVYAQFIPWRHVLRESLSRGEWPLWNPYMLSGDVLAAAGQPAVYSPLTLLACLLPPALSFTFSAAIAFFLAGAGAFAFARALGCRELTSSIAAAGFVCSSALALYILWPFGICWALLPWTMLATHRCVLAPGVRSWALLTTTLVLLVLAGHPESAMHVVFLGTLYGLFQLARTRAHLWRVLGTVFAAGIVALLICAIFLLPLLEAIPQTAEYPWRQVLRTLEPKTPLAELGIKLAQDFFPFLHLRRWIDPEIRSLQGETAAVGSIVLALAIYAIWRVRSGLTWFFAAVTAFGIAVQSGWVPLARLLQKVPLFDIAINERLAFGSAFFLAMLAALGAEEAIRRADRRGLFATCAGIFVILAAGTWWITRTFTLGPAPWGEHKIFAELALLAAVALVFAARTPMRLAVAGTLAFLVLQRGLSDGRVHHSFPARAAYPRIATLEPLRNIREPFRVAGLGWSLVPNMSALYGLEDVRGYEAMTFAPYFEIYDLWSVPQPVFFNRIDDLAKPILSMMNVRFALAPPDAPVPPGWRRVNAHLLENLHALDRAFVPNVVRLGLPDKAAVDEMAPVTDFRQLGWITADVQPYQRANGPGRVRALRPTPAHGYELDVDMDRDGWVIVTESAWKGWRAYLDGRRVKLQRGNVAFLAVYIPSGRHHLRLVYWPESFVVGRGVTFGTLLGVVAFLVIRRREVAKSRRRGGGGPA